MQSATQRMIASVILAAGLIFNTASFADDEKSTESATYPMFKPSNIKWVDAPKAMPAGAQMAVLAGNPDKKGLFIVRIKIPANYEMPVHNHSATEYVTVISGTLQTGEGNKFDKHATRALPAGSFFVIPKGVRTYEWTKEETIIQVGSMGPWKTQYFNKTDETKNKK